MPLKFNYEFRPCRCALLCHLRYNGAPDFHEYSNTPALLFPKIEFSPHGTYQGVEIWIDLKTESSHARNQRPIWPLDTYLI